MDSLVRQLFKGFVRQEFRLESYMTFLKGQWLDLELLLAHLGDDTISVLQALISVVLPHNAVQRMGRFCNSLFQNDNLFVGKTKQILKKQKQIMKRKKLVCELMLSLDVPCYMFLSSSSQNDNPIQALITAVLVLAETAAHDQQAVTVEIQKSNNKTFLVQLHAYCCDYIFKNVLCAAA